MIVNNHFETAPFCALRYFVLSLVSDAQSFAMQHKISYSLRYLIKEGFV